MQFMATSLRRLWSGFLRAMYIYFVHVPVVLFLLIGFYYVFNLLSRLTEDSTTVTNIAFGITSTLAALSFSCARAIDDAGEARDRFAYAGERFLHASIMALTASLLKYASLQLGLHPGGVASGLNSEWFAHTIPILGSICVGVIVLVLFFQALLSAHTGVLVLNRLLWQRLTRYPDWDNLW